jgi:lipopolysaccharide export system protein LptA
LKRCIICWLIILCTCCLRTVVAQQAIPSAADTFRVIQIVQAGSMREKTFDSANVFQTLAIGVVLKEGSTIFTCDSAAINKRTKVMEAFGNIHINQADSIHTYSQYLKYISTDRIAYLKKDVKLTDKKGTLFTQDLEYDLKANIGRYKNGGRVLNGKTTLTSQEGVYYADTRDVFFKKKVILKDPKYDIDSDTLLYNTRTEIVSWNTPTFISSKDGGKIFSSNGTYDLKLGKAYFASRTVFKDSTRTYVADNSAYDEKTGLGQLEGNAIIRDSVNGYTILGNQIFFSKKDQSFLATRKPVLIFKSEDNDSTFIAADTLFSGVYKKDEIGGWKKMQPDTIQETTVVSTATLPAISNSTAADDGNAPETAAKDSLPIKKNIPVADSATLVINKTTDLPVLDTTATTTPVKTDSLARIKLPLQTDTALAKTTIKDTTINLATDTAVRYFQAFHRVRIFNDSMQAVCDSLYYSSIDSAFRLFNDPLVFSNKSQISGDTIHLYTKNKKADRVKVWNNSLIINQINQNMYNQIGGRLMNGYFKAGALDYMRVRGAPAESVFYPQDDDSAYTGLNRCKGDLIDIYFADKAVNKVKFVNEVDGVLYPMKQIPEDQRYLAKFKWLDKLRPKNKLELFE